MKQLAFITIGSSRYEDRLREILDETGIDPEEFEALDYFSLLPVFVLAGASVATQVEAHGDHLHFEGVSLELPEEMEEPFYAVLPELLAQTGA